MSYSFSVRAATKAEAKAKVGTEFDQVVLNQPIHRKDREQAEALAFDFIDLLSHDATRDVSVAVNGSVGWVGPEDLAALTSASVSISVSLAPRSAA